MDHKIKNYLKKIDYKIYLSILFILITIVFFIIFFSIYKQAILFYLDEAISSTDTFFKRKIIEDIDFLFIKEKIDFNIQGTIDNVTNAINSNFDFKEFFKTLLRNILMTLLNAFNFLTNSLYIIVLIIQIVAIYIIIIFDSQKNRSTEPTTLAKGYLYIEKILKIIINKIIKTIKYLIKAFKDHKKMILIYICCFLFLNGFLFRLVFETFNILMHTNPFDNINAGMEVWLFDLLLLVLVAYIKYIGKHAILNIICIILAILLFLDSRAKKNRAKNVDKFKKIFSEVNLHELS